MNKGREINYRLYMKQSSGFKKSEIPSEYVRFRAVSSGDVEQARACFAELKRDYMNGKNVLSEDSVRSIRYNVVIAISMIAGLCAEEGMSQEDARTLAGIYIRKADMCGDADGIINILGEVFEDLSQRMSVIKKNNSRSVHIKKCINYIYDHLQEKLTIAGIAEYLSLDPSYLSKLFVRETGTSFRKFIITTKIEAAKEMMKDPELTIVDISTALGFSSQSAFITAFKKVLGETPKKYKETII